MQDIDPFTDNRAGDPFGLSIFTEKAIHWVPLTTDLSAIRLATPFVRPDAFPLEWWDRTLVGNAIVSCSELLQQRSEGDRILIVLTDGETPDLKGRLAQQIGQTLKSEKIILYAISVRTEGASEHLQTACQITGGQFYEAGDTPGLQAVFGQIDWLQRTELVAAQTQWLQHDRPFALAGLILLGLYRFAAGPVPVRSWACTGSQLGLYRFAALGLRYAP